ncbi:ChrR family anti-sigma-E factor [Azospirillum rugosum]|uniref:Transcriptional regulator n=1 Tax=Azospirillum rugosum TaxID=416170 RepID=A0ABS4SCJ2_9PROT|nr:ChrR family anti-sigma-E factor [Azospirillum rugosum]MBP2290281.1 putative transcriptional regulator [Azospirillum rugosum]MDQ0527757.1 putative transcriptional regulator [Azospirillum rugosum]
MPAHHPAPELLFDYAAGSLREVQALLVASHLAYCAECRRRVAELEACGGVLLEEVAAEPVSDGLLDAVLAKLADAPAALPPQPATPPPNGILPGPLHRALGGSMGGALDGVDWVRIVPGIHLSGWSLGVGTASACLLRMAAGASVPAHRHTDHEMLLVLTGAFSDEFGRYRVGDVASYDPDTPHHAVADRDGECVCLLVQDKPLVFTGALGWLLNRGFRF